MLLKLIQGDITKVQADAVVNAANSTLMGGGGVDGAIHRAGGKKILESCKRIVACQGNCPPGEAVITTAGDLPAKYVIHTVGPIWHGGQLGEAKILESCYRNSLQLAVEYKCKSIAFPNISCGIYGYPKQKAAKIAINTVKKFLENDHCLELVIFVCFDEENTRFIGHLLGQ